MVGELENTIITSSGTAPYPVFSVGKFSVTDAHHVVDPVSMLAMINTKLTLLGATKDSLNAFPNFTFAL